MKAKEAMHKGVEWVSPDTPVTGIAKEMLEQDIGALRLTKMIDSSALLGTGTSLFEL
jgi:hypothetical protein